MAGREKFFDDAMPSNRQIQPFIQPNRKNKQRIGRGTPRRHQAFPPVGMNNFVCVFLKPLGPRARTYTPVLGALVGLPARDAVAACLINGRTASSESATLPGGFEIGQNQLGGESDLKI